MIDLKCEMCGSKNIKIIFLPDERKGMYSKPERLKCRCQTCSYDWLSKTLKQIMKEKNQDEK